MYIRRCTLNYGIKSVINSILGYVGVRTEFVSLPGYGWCALVNWSPVGPCSWIVLLSSDNRAWLCCGLSIAWTWFLRFLLFNHSVSSLFYIFLFRCPFVSFLFFSFLIAVKWLALLLPGSILSSVFRSFPQSIQASTIAALETVTTASLRTCSNSLVMNNCHFTLYSLSCCSPPKTLIP